MSAPGAVITGSIWPGSITSSRGQGFGLRWQNNKKSKAISLGSMARLACTWPGATPDVIPRHALDRIF